MAYLFPAPKPVVKTRLKAFMTGLIGKREQSGFFYLNFKSSLPDLYHYLKVFG